jgi:hypothetical protein
LTARRHRIIYAFGLTSLLLLAISLARIGWWLPEFLAQIGQYEALPRQWMLSDIGSLPGLIWLAGTVVLLAWGGKRFWADRTAFPFVLFWGSISLMLLVTPHTMEYDLPILLLPFIFYAPRFLRSPAGTAGWLFLWWLPWLSWAISGQLGYTTGVWYSFFWFHYPQILIVGLLVWGATTGYGVQPDKDGPTLAANPG